MLGFGKKRAQQFDALVRPHLDSLFRLAYHLSGERSDAEDLVQDVLVKLMPKTDELARVERLRPWLKRVLYRQFIDHHRKQSRRLDVNLTLVGNAGSEDDSGDIMERIANTLDGPADSLGRQQLQQSLQKLLQTLSPDQRALIIMHDMEGRPQEEIADILGVPVGTVKSRLHRTRAQLKRKVALELEPAAAVSRVKSKR
ncbi:MAG: RNA polymerase sigma factor [Halomonadaceae bacterium]|nr:MAG: RNA polymerase sigma factor [Halomonadaceae bacterium]